MTIFTITSTAKTLLFLRKETDQPLIYLVSDEQLSTSIIFLDSAD